MPVHTYYISTTGNDGTGAADDPAHPYATFGTVVPLLAAGDTISIGAGIFIEQVPLAIRLVANITIVGAGQDLTTIQMPASGTAQLFVCGGLMNFRPILAPGTGCTVQDLKLLIPSTTPDPGQYAGIVAEGKDNITLLRVKVICNHVATYVGGNWITSSGGSIGVVLSDHYSFANPMVGTCQNVTITDCTISASEYGLLVCGSGTITNLVCPPAAWEICGTNGVSLQSDSEANHATNAWTIAGLDYRQDTIDNRNASNAISAIVFFYSDVAASNIYVELTQSATSKNDQNQALIFVGGDSNQTTVSLGGCILRCEEFGGGEDLTLAAGLVALTISQNWDQLVVAADKVLANQARWANATRSGDVGSLASKIVQSDGTLSTSGILTSGAAYYNDGVLEADGSYKTLAATDSTPYLAGDDDRSAADNAVVLAAAGSIIRPADGGDQVLGVDGTATLPAAANVATGTGTYGIGGTSRTPSYPTTATTQATQLATDKAAVVAAKANIRKDYAVPGFGITGADRGTLDVTADNPSTNGRIGLGL